MADDTGDRLLIERLLASLEARMPEFESSLRKAVETKAGEPKPTERTDG